MDISQKLQEIKQEIARITAMKPGNRVKILGVTKTVDVERIKEASQAGVEAFGENKVQEFLEKYEKLPNLEWHFIGHLQTNKINKILGKVSLIHSLDRYNLAEEINKRAYRLGIVVPVLLEVNMAKEESKFGLMPEEVVDFYLEARENFKNLEVSGLMTVAPYVDNPEEVRPVFRGMRELFLKLKALDPANEKLQYLSMGMSNDYKVAVEEGANIIRLGTLLFGERNY
ncbi:YggS family pyridoxal phosphate-dependent enzyme [Carboxydothermus pertinax]|uniref:Pyridoxal phosphate homeostasis protein n=1 Tax=Carboxydothermus pertinax TaxID=870242 RepID=A0A1L8CSA5_9THEO|nr:YggS family pyridoxal phosphate-dependent enzyme [Carboxydothermus pertinax]GAV21801.1 YggS family pyridoxal phosphate enzyme [Carboxydothermus pertinax]